MTKGLRIPSVSRLSLLLGIDDISHFFLAPRSCYLPEGHIEPVILAESAIPFRAQAARRPLGERVKP
jgi:hypothetical protein